MRQMNGPIKGLPDALTPHMLGLWTSALSLARKEFDEQTVKWQSQVEHAESALACAEQERDQAISQSNALHEKIAGLQEAIAALHTQIITERSAREQAEHLFETHQQELAQQRTILRAALDHSKHELSHAIKRLEGAENHALIEIDRARMEARTAISTIEEHAKREKDEHMLEMTRLNHQLQEQRVQCAQAAKQIDGLRTDLVTVEGKAKSDQALSQQQRKTAAAEVHRIAERLTRVKAERDQAAKDLGQARQEAAHLAGQCNTLKEQLAALLARMTPRR